jgi:hypothetical protein
VVACHRDNVCFVLSEHHALAKRQAWTAQKKWYAIELKRKSTDKKLNDGIVAMKAKYDLDVSASTLHGWLKPENAAKIEELVNEAARTMQSA